MRKCYIALRVNIDFTTLNIRIDAKAGSSANPHARMYQYSRNWESKCNLGSEDLIFIETESDLWFQDLDVMTLEECAKAERAVQAIKDYL